MPTQETERPRARPPELWGGVECTVNRVGDRYFDQLELSGHGARAQDLDLFASLGIKAMRYPVLWERTAPDGLARADWTWADTRLSRLRQLNLRPVVGLVHHGSGPRDTSLVDTEFPEKLAAYARAVAERYPWVEDYTPVNEPLTTARFSGLYGHWYPHGRCNETFARALVTQLRAVVLSMKAVREVNPSARLIQTEDLGKTFSTRALKAQAEFENERRWLTFDLLCGRLDRFHPMWGFLTGAGIEESELEWLRENNCPPDVVGVNHYVTSERFLDERVERYPPHTHGGNGFQAYADVEAVRARAEGCAGPRALLREAWERYGLPLAVTEAHLGCTREEQLRWLTEVWEAARGLREEGADVRAVTAWTLLGSFDWDSLVTRAQGHYEPGVYDLRGGRARPTALARLIKELAGGSEPAHAVLEAPGWWRRLERLLYFPERKRARAKNADVKMSVNSRPSKGGGKERTLLLTGATGTLGRAFARACRARAIPFRLLTRAEMDIADESSVAGVFEEASPWAVVNAAGYVRVDDAEADRERCMRENAEGPAVLAEACAARGASLVTFSSDLVFDGASSKAYVESDAVSPLNVYGRSKADAEARVLASHPSALVVRTSAFFGPWDEYNFVTLALRALARGRRFAAASDSVVSPTYVPDLVNACLDLLIDGERGVWHLANRGAVSWAEFARLAARAAGLDESLVEERPTASFNFAARRPAFSALASERGALLPALEDALARYVAECDPVLYAPSRRSAAE
ncbi:MAG TPA: family 1 glycosylhydrolase [Pyrinomonadaceae bacterium]|nr:family 1 glycosylhydrolase [Pyrinomonadaceae bacterium]